jgi:hypothetical protein
MLSTNVDCRSTKLKRVSEFRFVSRSEGLVSVYTFDTHLEDLLTKLDRFLFLLNVLVIVVNVVVLIYNFNRNFSFQKYKH